MMDLNPFFLTDGYKTGHHMMYPKGTKVVYSNFTPRSNKYAPKGCDRVVTFGPQMVMIYLRDVFNAGFFKPEAVKQEIAEYIIAGHSPEKAAVLGKARVKQRVMNEIQVEYSRYLGSRYKVKHIEALWDLGYLPIKVKALPEGTKAPMGIPVLTIYNTIGEFYWLTNFLETIISTLLWKPMTSATIADHFYKKIINKYLLETDETNPAGRYLAHDFSMRGMDAPFAVMASGLGHALSFDGSDSLPVIPAARYYYNAQGNIINSVNATEHSVMCAGTKEDEIGTFRYLMKQFPKGILSIVSDTWDLWKVLTVILPKLKEEILKRDGKIVIRPDSGDPVDIICGDKTGLDEDGNLIHPKGKGVVELLWDVFGGTINAQGYKVLDPHIGAIYGDSINAERAVEICERLKAKGFASTNVVLGIGSFTYQYNTRDTFGFAMKATYCEVLHNGNGKPSKLEAREIFKDPITDDGTKKSAKGLLQVYKVKGAHGMSDYLLKDQCTWEEEAKGELKTIFEDGIVNDAISLDKIRETLKKER
jgi:nicotinamide phosphoribosyltransferase